MLLDQETLRFIFGMKLRAFRQEKGLSLLELSKLSRLSPSYLNEIEKGKKYPKGDKIAVLAGALGVSYDDLISVKLKKELATLSQILERNLLRGLPFDVFGVPAQSLYELMADRPQQVGALVGTILELARNHHLNVEEFFHAALRSYLDMNENYIGEIEGAATEFKTDLLQVRPDAIPTDFLNLDSMKLWLQRTHGLKVEETDFSTFPEEIRHLFYLYQAAPKPRLLVNRLLDEREKRFILAREIGFAVLGLEERLVSSVSPVDAFDPLLNNLKANYFASALLIPESLFIEEVNKFFDQDRWNAEKFREWIFKYPGPAESFFHRLLQLLPRHFGLSELFYLKMRFNRKNGQYALHRELHLSSAYGPHRAQETEHYCRRWLTTSLLEASDTDKAPAVGTQRSHFFGSKSEYLCFAMASTFPTREHRRVASTIGIHLSEVAKTKIQLLKDPSIRLVEVADTCERCGIENCAERAAPASIFDHSLRQRKIQEALQSTFATL